MKLLVAFAIVLFGVVAAEPGYGYFGHSSYGSHGGYGGYGYGASHYYGKRAADADESVPIVLPIAARPFYGYYGNPAYGYGNAPTAYGYGNIVVGKSADDMDEADEKGWAGYGYYG